MSGICLDRRAFTSSFSAQIWASSTLDCRRALFVRAVVACSPAASAMATIASATRTSISVKPRCASVSRRLARWSR